MALTGHLSVFSLKLQATRSYTIIESLFEDLSEKSHTVRRTTRFEQTRNELNIHNQDKCMHMHGYPDHFQYLPTGYVVLFCSFIVIYKLRLVISW